VAGGKPIAKATAPVLSLLASLMDTFEFVVGELAANSSALLCLGGSGAIELATSDQSATRGIYLYRRKRLTTIWIMPVSCERSTGLACARSPLPREMLDHHPP
jgi:hypothetical protein